MPVSNDYLNDSVQEIWSSMLDLDITPLTDASELPGLDRDNFGVTGLIQIKGVWNGAVMLTCHKETAIELAKYMFLMEEESPTEEELQDALGELTNMVSGRVKLIVGEPCQLSLPMVIEGQQYDLSVVGSVCTVKADYGCLGQRIHVRIFEPAQTRTPRHKRSAQAL